MLSRIASLIRASDRKADGYSRDLQTARLRASYQRAYFAPALFNLVPVRTDLIATMAVDAYWRLYYNESWLATHTVEENAALAGEMSGHMFFADRFFGFDDAVYATLRLLEIVAASDIPLHEMLADVPETFATPELRADCPDELKFGIVDQVLAHYRPTHRVIDVDGARIQFEGGWGLVRASNTQPVLVLRFEADTEERLREIRSEVEDEVARLSGRTLTDAAH